MAEITASLVKELRDATGISMMKCKNALTEADGDMEKAREILRKQGEADAAKRSAREAGEGIVVVKAEGGKSVILKLACETDFVAKGDDFVNLANDLLAEAWEKGVDAVKNNSEAKIQEAIQKNGENIKLGEVESLEGENIADYIHSNNKIGVLVSLAGGSAELGKDIAMQIAAMNPSVISPSEVDETEVEDEKKIQKEILEKEGKPAEMLDKILEGKMKKFREEKSLLKQDFVKDPSKTIETVLDEGGAKVVKFVRVAV